MDDTVNAILDANLPPALQVTLLEVYRSADGTLFVGTHQEIAEKRGVERGTVSEQIRTLIARGHLKKKGGCLIINGDSISGHGGSPSTDGDSTSASGDTASDDGDSVSTNEDSASETAKSSDPPRQKKVSTPSKKNSSPRSEPSSSLGSEDCSGDGAPSESGDDATVSAGGLPDDDTNHPAIGIYRSNAERYPNREDRRRIIDAVGEKGTDKFANRMTPWRKTMNDWAENSWSWGNIDDMLDRFHRKLKQHNARNGHRDRTKSDEDRALDELAEG